jgi:hypothetical protein
VIRKVSVKAEIRGSARRGRPTDEAAARDQACSGTQDHRRVVCRPCGLAAALKAAARSLEH